jgi:hypothetical protein
MERDAARGEHVESSHTTKRAVPEEGRRSFQSQFPFVRIKIPLLL